MKTNNRLLAAFAALILALGGCGGGGKKNPAAPPTAPSAPTGLAATAANAQVSLSWSAVSGAATYKVKRSTTSGGPYTEVQSSVSTTSHTDTGLTNGTTYYYVVAAANNVGESGNSNQASATPAASAQVPSAPTGLAATAANAQVSLSWGSVSGAATYKVKRSTTSGGPYTEVQSSVSTTSFTDTGLTNGTTYYYVVAAVNTIGESGNSNQASATPSASSQVPAPMGLTATAGNGRVALTWNAVPGATGYNVFQSSVYQTNSWIGSTTSLSFSDVGLFNNTTYTYQVSAENSGGEGPRSNQVSATPSGAGLPPAAPTGLIAGFRNAQVVLGWAAAPGATAYKIYRGGTLVGTTGETIYTDVGLTNGTEYSYEVAGTNGVGESTKSAVARATPRDDVPSGHSFGCPAFPAFPDENCTGWRHLVGKTVTYADGQQRVFTALRTGCSPVSETTESFYIYADNATFEDCYFSKNLVIVGRNVTIKRSQVHGIITAHGNNNYDFRGLSLIDVEIEQEGDPISKLTQSATRGDNYRCLRCDVHHTVSGLHAGDNATIEDSYTHDFFYVDGSHGAGIGMGQGLGSHTRLIHNSVQCNRQPGQPGICSSALSIYGESKDDRGVPLNIYVKNIHIEKNLFNTTGSYCVHAPSTAGTHIRYVDNRFGKKFTNTCAVHGPVRDFVYPHDPQAGSSSQPACPFPQDASPRCNVGNQWSSNLWQDGSGPVTP